MEYCIKDSSIGRLTSLLHLVSLSIRLTSKDRVKSLRLIVQAFVLTSKTNWAKIFISISVVVREHNFGN